MREIGLRLRQNRLALAGLVLILIFMLMAVFARSSLPTIPIGSTKTPY